MARQRLTVQEAADHLGTSVDAVRKRVARGSMASDKGEDGRVYVWLDTDRTERHVDGDVLVDTLRDQVSYLRGQLSEEREARRRADTIIAQLARANEEQARTIRAIEAPAASPAGEPQDAPGGSDTSTEELEVVEEQTAPAEAPEPTEEPSEEAEGEGQAPEEPQPATHEPPEAPETASSEPERVEPSPARPDPGRVAEEPARGPIFTNDPPRRSLWRRLLGR